MPQSTNRKTNTRRRKRKDAKTLEDVVAYEDLTIQALRIHRRSDLNGFHDDKIECRSGAQDSKSRRQTSSDKSDREKE